jgi:hypothetical protein
MNDFGTEASSMPANPLTAERLEREYREGFIAGFMEAGGRHSNAMAAYRRWRISPFQQASRLLQDHLCVEDK